MRTWIIMMMCLLGGAVLGGLADRSRPWPVKRLAEMVRRGRISLQLLPLGPAIVPGSFSAIQIESLEDASAKRSALITYIWKGAGFPRQPAVIDPSGFSVAFDDLPSALIVSHLTLTMPYGVRSNFQLIRARRSGNCLMLFSEGHETEVDETQRLSSRHVIDRILSAGCDVLAFQMPLTGQNNRPTVKLRRFGTIRFRSHNMFPLLDSDEFSSIRFFVDPVAAGLEYALARRSYARTGFLGLSGGGWLAAFYSALDPRIQASYPVAGTEPMALRALRAEGLGDYEQSLAALYRIANYEEQYVMAASQGRRQLQAFIRADPCCFAGLASSSYAPAVAEVSRHLGGRFHVLVDEHGVRHEIGDDTLTAILRDFLE